MVAAGALVALLVLLVVTVAPWVLAFTFTGRALLGTVAAGALVAVEAEDTLRALAEADVLADGLCE